MNNKNTYLKVRFQKNKEASLDNKTCVLLVSVGQKYHEDEWLSSQIDLINHSNFSKCTIAVADTLQRHNFQDKTREEAYNSALLMGDEWLKRNADCLNKLTPEVEILRWDAALSHENYSMIRQQLEKAYLENKTYTDAVNSTINTFVERVQKRSPDADLEAIFANCLEYLIEECPIIMPLWAAQGYDFIIYPKVMTNAMAMTYELFVKPFYPDKGNWLSINFKRLAMPTIDSRQDVSVVNYTNNYSEKIVKIN